MNAPSNHAAGDWKFFGGWLFATVAGGLAALVVAVMFLAMFMFSRASVTSLALVGGLASGAVLGAVQWLALRTRLPWAALWILATTLGAALSIPIIFYLSQLAASGSLSDAWVPYLSALLLGATLGACQCFVLRNRPGAGLWILASAFAAASAMPFATLPGSAPILGPLAWIMYAGVFLLPAAITGAALVWLLKQSSMGLERRGFWLSPAFSLALVAVVILMDGVLWSQILTQARAATGAAQSRVVPTATPRPPLVVAALGQLVLTGHSGAIRGLTFAPDSRTLATASADGTVRLWDALTGKNTRTFTVGIAALSVAFAPDGRTVAAGLNGRDGQPNLKVWDIATGSELQSIVAHMQPVYSVAYSPNGQLLVSGSIDRTVKVWGVDNWQTRATFSGHTDWIYSVAVAPSSVNFASASWDHTVKLWRLDRPDVVTLSRHADKVMSVAYSPNGLLLASGAMDSQVKLWNTTLNTEERTLSGHRGAVNTVAFAPDSQTLASGSDDGTVRLWDVQTGAEIQTWDSNSDRVTAVSFSPDGRSVASGSADATVRLRMVKP